jgi:hypothetical protein
MSRQKCFGSSICTTLQNWAAQRIDRERLSSSFLRQKVARAQPNPFFRSLLEAERTEAEKSQETIAQMLKDLRSRSPNLMLGAVT